LECKVEGKENRDGINANELELPPGASVCAQESGADGEEGKKDVYQLKEVTLEPSSHSVGRHDGDESRALEP